MARGGDHCVGGVTWLDWRREFVASPDIGRQIVGHTTMFSGRPDVINLGGLSESWCIVCQQNCYGIITDRRFEPYFVVEPPPENKEDT